MERARSRTIEFEGIFDAGAARRLAAQLSGEKRGAQVRVDLSAVREFHDSAVAALADAIAAVPGVHVELRGLRAHQARLLRYFGLASAAL